MNPVLMLAYQNAAMTKAAVESVLAQSIPTHITVVDNGSTDNTLDVLHKLEERHPERIHVVHIDVNTAPTIVANHFLSALLSEHPFVLTVANDILLPPTFYAELLRWPRGLVAASQITDRDVYDTYIKSIPPTAAVNENTHMAVLLIRSWAYAAVIAKDGYFFDESFFSYASDQDLALRVSACGIRGVQLNTPFYHYNSASWRTQPEFAQHQALRQADRDRAHFVSKWGFAVDAPSYTAAAFDINFKG